MENEDKSTALVTTSPADLLQLAIEKDVDIDKLEKLMAMSERWNAQQAKKSFLVAMATFQSKCPELKKGKSVVFGDSSKAKYKYIPLGEIVKQIKAPLKSCGLSYRWKTEEVEGKIKLTCIVSHIDGHSECNTMTAEKDTSGNKNSIQSIGSTMTYLQRYTIIGALGIATADEDADGEKPKAPQAPKKDAKISAKLLYQAKTVVDVYEKADELEKNAREFLDEESEKGMTKEDRALLSEYITNKYNKLNKDDDKD